MVFRSFVVDLTFPFRVARDAVLQFFRRGVDQQDALLPLPSGPGRTSSTPPARMHAS